LGGNFMSEQIRLMFASQPTPVPLVPHYQVKAKTPVDAGQASQAIYKKFEIPPTDSYRKWEEERVFTEFKESVVQVWEGPSKLSAPLPGASGQTNEDAA
jgi:actin-related protein 4